MNLKTAESYLCAYRKEKPNEPPVEKALRAATGDGELCRRLEEQVEFDRQFSRAIQAIVPPEGLRQRVLGGGASAGQRPRITLSAWIPAACGLAIIVALAVIFALDRETHFPGREAVNRIVISANDMSGLELDPVSNPAGDLGDWFYVRGFEAYHLPPELAAAPALGARLFKQQDGNTVAQVAVDWHHAILYVFRADVFGVELPQGGEWHRLQVDEWQAALRKDGNICTLVTIRGGEPEMREFLASLKKP